MVSITGGINWVKQQARDPHRYAVRAKEVLGAACSGAVFGAVSKAVKDYVGSPQAQRDALSHAVYSTAAIGGAAALIVGGMAGYRIVENAGAETAENGRPRRGRRALLFGAGSACRDAIPQALDRFGGAAGPAAGAVSVERGGRGVIESRAVLHRQSAQSRGHAMAAGRQPASDHGGRHADRPLPLRQPAQDVAAPFPLTASYAAAIGSHTGLGAAGSLLGHVYDWARGTDRYQNLTHDHGYAQENRHVVPEPCAQLGMKVALGLAVAWAASSIARHHRCDERIDRNEAGDLRPGGLRRQCAVRRSRQTADPCFRAATEPGRGTAPPAERGTRGAAGNPQQNDQQPPPDTLADDQIGGHDGDPPVDPENGVEMEVLTNIP